MRKPAPIRERLTTIPANGRKSRPETSVDDPRARPEKAGGGGLRVGQMGDFVFDSELLALKLADQGLIRVRPAFLFEDQVFEVLVLGLERFDMLRSGHLEPSLRTRFVTV
jgi:hypothetical protein